MDRNGTAFLYLRQKFPLLIDAKIGEGVFTGLDIHSLLHDELFERIIMGDEQRVWHAFREVITGFLGNRRQITTRILWKNYYRHIRNWGAICP